MNSIPGPKIAVVVQGRFYAFDLVRELIRQGQDVTLFTNYPKAVVKKFGIPSQNTRSFFLHGLLSRFLPVASRLFRLPSFEPFLHVLFSRWAARQLARQSWDVVKVFSGVAEEVFRSLAGKPALKLLVRASSHILVQARLLEEEEKRAGVPIDRPSPWMIARELREYGLADAILVISSFCRHSFMEQGTAGGKVKTLLLGTETGCFRPDQSVIEERCRRIQSEPRLRVLTVGTFSYRKGVLDLTEMVKQLAPVFDFRFVGKVMEEAKQKGLDKIPGMEFIPHQRQCDLPGHYAWADLFVFPTLEDGFAVVLSQAQAAGLCILATTNCAGPDIIREGKTGWVLPVRNPRAFADRLLWCNAHRAELGQITREIRGNFRPRSWDEVANDFLVLMKEWPARG